MQSYIAKQRGVVPGLASNDWKGRFAENDVFVGMVRDAMRCSMGILVARNAQLLPRRPSAGHKTIHVWWLLDDGGFTFLIAYLLSQHRFFRAPHCEVRLFTVADDKVDRVALLHSVAAMMREFRFKCKVEALHAATSAEVAAETARLQASFPGPARKGGGLEKWVVVSKLMAAHTPKAEDHVNICSIPAPDRFASSHEFLAVLDLLSALPCPTILVRGNGDIVITPESE